MNVSSSLYIWLIKYITEKQFMHNSDIAKRDLKTKVQFFIAWFIPCSLVLQAGVLDPPDIL